MLSALDTLTLLHTPGIGHKTALRAQRLARHLRGESAPLGELLQAIQADHPRMPLPSTEDLRQGAEEARAEIEHCEEAGIDILPAGSPGYPARLNGIDGWPPVLYRRGTSKGLLRSIAIIGTRDPSSWAPGRARAAARCAVEVGLWVVSGLALGCDAAAHRGCLQAGGRTLAIVAHDLTSWPTDLTSWPTDLTRSIRPNTKTWWRDFSLQAARSLASIRPACRPRVTDSFAGTGCRAACPAGPSSSTRRPRADRCIQRALRRRRADRSGLWCRPRRRCRKETARSWSTARRRCQMRLPCRGSSIDCRSTRQANVNERLVSQTTVYETPLWGNPHRRRAPIEEGRGVS